MIKKLYNILLSYRRTLFDNMPMTELLKMTVVKNFIDKYMEWDLYNKIPQPLLKKCIKTNKIILTNIDNINMETYGTSDESMISKLKYVISTMNKHIRQYNNNNKTKFKTLTIIDLSKHGLVKKFLDLTLYNNKVGFILLHHHLGWDINNIIVGNRKIREQVLLDLTIKYCGSCRKFRDKTEFKQDNSKYDRLDSECKTCILKQSRTKHGLIRRIYNRQVHSSKTRGHTLPGYSKKWLKDWCLKQTKFHELYNNWVKNKYDKNFTPSVDRINFRKGYLKNNIQLMTWRENNLKSHLEIKEKKRIKNEQAINNF